MRIIYGVSILAGTIVGAGLFSLPYITSVVGIYTILFYILLLGIVSLLIHLFLGAVSLNTPDFMRLPGFAKYHLGKGAQKVAYLSGILGMMGAVLAYIVLGGVFTYSLFSPTLGGGEVLYTTLYFLIGAYFIFFGIKAISKVQLLGLVFFFVLLFFILLRGWSFISLENIFYTKEGAFDLFLPYGPLLFALWGGSLIPEIEEMLGEDKKKLPLVISLGIFVALLISVLFIFLIFSITGPNTTSDALSGLKGSLGNGVISLALLFGVITTFTSFVAIGLTLKKIFWYDLKINKHLSWAMTCIIPFLLYLLGARDFVLVIGTVGAVMIAIDAILVSFMYEKIKSKKVRFITYPLIIVFLIGIVYEVVYYLT